MFEPSIGPVSIVLGQTTPQVTPQVATEVARAPGDRPSRRPNNSNIGEPLLTTWLTKRGHTAQQIANTLHRLRPEATNHSRNLYGTTLQHSRLLHVPAEATVEKKEAVLSRWYRSQQRAAVPPLLATWQPFLGVTAGKWYVQRMKTLWGSCNTSTRTICLNTELAKKPRECLEYILVHELAHLLEPTYNARFLSLMDAQMPTSRHHRAQLNQLPVRHEDWRY